MPTPRSTLRRALGAGTIAAAATTGLLVGAGRQLGNPWGLFERGGRVLIDSRGLVGEVLPTAAVALGVAHHVVIVLLWGALLAVVAGTRRLPLRVALLGGLVAALAWGSRSWLPVVTRPDLALDAPLRWAVFGALALGVLLGGWAAAPSRHAST